MSYFVLNYIERLGINHKNMWKKKSRTYNEWYYAIQHIVESDSKYAISEI